MGRSSSSCFSWNCKAAKDPELLPTSSSSSTPSMVIMMMVMVTMMITLVMMMMTRMMMYMLMLMMLRAVLDLRQLSGPRKNIHSVPTKTMLRAKQWGPWWKFLQLLQWWGFKNYFDVNENWFLKLFDVNENDDEIPTHMLKKNSVLFIWQAASPSFGWPDKNCRNTKKYVDEYQQKKTQCQISQFPWEERSVS